MLIYYLYTCLHFSTLDARARPPTYTTRTAPHPKSNSPARLGLAGAERILPAPPTAVRVYIIRLSSPEPGSLRTRLGHVMYVSI